MKHTYLLIFLSFVLLTSCNKNGRMDRSVYFKELSFPITPCDHIDKSMVVCHFGVSSSELNSIEEGLTSNHSLGICGFRWAKSDLEESSEGDQRVKGSNHLKIGLFKKYENVKIAQKEFYDSYMAMLNLKDDVKPQQELRYSSFISFNSEAEEKENVKVEKFKMVEGIGDQAFYDYELKSLNVLFGNVSFSVFINSEFDVETDILIAKKVANRVWKEL